ncbi:MAG: RDD family protein [Phycisphaeraceae bacterium]|nr:RDD family protein [Phycisphaeraceae bacterium]
MGMNRAMILIGFVVWVCAHCARAEMPSAGSVSGLAGPSHGWVVLPDPNPRNERATMLAHVAPRAGLYGASDGLLYPAMRLEQPAVAIAAVSDRVYMLFDPPPERDSGSLEVLSLRAVLTPIAGMYAYEPRGRLDAHRSLSRRGGLLGVAGTSEGVFAVVRSDEPGAVGGVVVSRLSGSAWDEVTPFPTDGDGGVDLQRPVDVVTIDGRLGIVGHARGGGLSVWVRSVEPGPGSENGDDDAGVWVRRGLASFPDEVPGVRFVGVGSVLVAVGWLGSSLNYWTDIGGGWYRIAAHDECGQPVGIVPLGDVGRVVAVWTGEGDEGGVERGAASAKVWEVSASTGLVFHDGSAARRGPLSTQDFRALIVLLVGATTAVLLFVIRIGDDSGVLTLPRGVALAPSGRRVAASVIDLCVAVGAVWLLTGASPGQQLDVLKLTPGGMGVMGLVDIVVVGFFAGTIAEAFFGCSIGKGLLGCEVLPVVGRETIDRRGLGLLRAATRNAVKWALPPAAMLGLFEAGGRHRGDVAAGAVVVERFDPEESSVRGE